jgi:cold shock CspA family protein
MPVRIYDISMKLGLANNDILAKARALNITAAKVPSSSLDIISAQYLEEELIKDRPELASRLAPKPAEVPRPSVEEQKIVLNSAPPPPQKPQITITVTGVELSRLVDQIKNGEVEFRLNVADSGHNDRFGVCIVQDTDETPVQLKPKSDLTTRIEIDERTKDLLRAAYYSARHRAIDGWLNLADYGSAVKKQEPTFLPQKFGERSLGSLLRRVDFFELRNDELNPIVYYVRMKVVESNLPATGPAHLPKVDAASSPKLARGKIHNLRLGFGFIMPDDGSENAFFHATDVEGCTIYDLKPGDAVEYEPGFNEKGPCARKIHRLTN